MMMMMMMPLVTELLTPPRLLGGQNSSIIIAYPLLLVIDGKQARKGGAEEAAGATLHAALGAACVLVPDHHQEAREYERHHHEYGHDHPSLMGPPSDRRDGRLDFRFVCRQGGSVRFRLMQSAGLHVQRLRPNVLWRLQLGAAVQLQAAACASPCRKIMSEPGRKKSMRGRKQHAAHATWAHAASSASLPAARRQSS